MSAEPNYKAILFAMEDDIHSIRSYAAVISGVLAFAGSLSELEKDGVFRVVNRIEDHSEALIESFRAAFYDPKVVAFRAGE